VPYLTERTTVSSVENPSSRATTQVKFARWITKDDVEDEGSDGVDQLIEDEYDWEPGGDQDFQ
jgi:hypothetical protein